MSAKVTSVCYPDLQMLLMCEFVNVRFHGQKYNSCFFTDLGMMYDVRELGRLGYDGTCGTLLHRV